MLILGNPRLCLLFNKHKMLLNYVKFMLQLSSRAIISGQTVMVVGEWISFKGQGRVISAQIPILVHTHMFIATRATLLGTVMN